MSRSARMMDGGFFYYPSQGEYLTLFCYRWMFSIRSLSCCSKLETSQRDRLTLMNRGKFSIMLSECQIISYLACAWASVLLDILILWFVLCYKCFLYSFHPNLRSHRNKNRIEDLSLLSHSLLFSLELHDPLVINHM